jgi:hypothetical protein
MKTYNTPKIEDRGSLVAATLGFITRLSEPVAPPRDKKF